jgi:hypothetical protein
MCRVLSPDSDAEVDLTDVDIKPAPDQSIHDRSVPEPNTHDILLR